MFRLSNRYFLIALFVLALTLRGIYLYEIADNPFFASLNNDPLTFDTQAREIAAGNWLGHDVFFKAPFYPYFLAIIYRLFGHSYLLPRLIQTLIGSFTFLLLYFIGRRTFDEATARLAAIFAATYGMFIYFENELLITFAEVFGNLAALLLLLRAMERPTRTRWFVAGLALGLSAIARPNILLFCPFIPLWLWIEWRGGIKPLWGTIVRATVLVAVGTLTIIAPVTIRNYVVGHDVVLISAQGGLAFQGGNNPACDGVFAVPTGVPHIGGTFWEEDCHAVAEQALGRKLKPSEASRYWFKKGLTFWRDEPLAAVKLYARKIHLFLHGYELPNNQDFYFFRQYSVLMQWLPVRFGWIAPCALIGLFLTNRDQLRKRSLLYLFGGVYSTSIILFFVSDRHRMPVVPLFLLFAAASIIWLYQQLAARRWAVLYWLIPTYVALFFILNFPIYDVQARNDAQEQFNLGNAWYRAGQYELATAAFDSAIALNPRFPRANLNLGVIALDNGQLDVAAARFVRELQFNRYDEMAHNNAGIVAEKMSDSTAAIGHYQEAIRIRPTYLEAYLNLSRFLLSINQPQQAYESCLQAVEHTKLTGELAYQVAVAAFQMQQYEEATQWNEKATALEPERATYWHQRALIENTRGNTEAGLYYLKKALDIEPGHTAIWHDLGAWYMQQQRLPEAEAAFLKALQTPSPFAETYFNLGLLNLAQKDSMRAAAYFSRAAELNPAFYFTVDKVNQLTK